MGSEVTYVVPEIIVQNFNCINSTNMYESINRSEDLLFMFAYILYGLRKEGEYIGPRLLEKLLIHTPPPPPGWHSTIPGNVNHINLTKN